MISLVLMSAMSVAAQESNTVEVSSITDGNSQTYTVSEQLPEYPGGLDALLKFLSYNIKYPAEAAKEGIQGRVVVKFVVNKNGDVESPEVVRSKHPLLDAEALRVVGLLKFSPGKINGKAVNTWYSLPIKFKL